jgi:hypothetical protein
MALRDLIFKSEDKPKPKSDSVKFPEQKVEPVAEKTFFPDFPTDTPLFEGDSTSTNIPVSCQPHIDKISEMYEKGFENLNQDGYDFFEYLKSVAETDHSPTAYKMAFTMGKTMKKDLSPETLIEQSKFYLTKIDEVYKGYKAQGEKIQAELLNKKSQEESSLKSEVSRLENEIKQKQKELSEKQSVLSGMDRNYSVQMEDLQLKWLRASILSVSMILKRKIIPPLLSILTLKKWDSLNKVLVLSI